MPGVIEPPESREEIGKFNNVAYVRHRGRFRGDGASGRFDVPYEICAPANPVDAGGACLFEPLHFTSGAIARDFILGRDFLFGRGFSHATVRHRTYEATFISSVIRDGWMLFGGYANPKRLQQSEFQSYLDTFTKAADALVSARYLLPAGRERMLAQAKLHPPNTYTINYLEGRFFAPPTSKAVGLDD